jgi:hypothetical protein
VNKLTEDFRIAILGAAAALFSSSVTLLIARIDTYYAYLAWLRESGYSDYQRVEDLSWIPASVWHVILSVVASLLVHRYLTTQLRSPFLLWQVIGMSSLLGWALTFVLAVSLRCIVLGNLSSLEGLVQSEDLLLVGKYAATVFACNVLYGSVISASSRQYVEQFESEECASR